MEQLLLQLIEEFLREHNLFMKTSSGVGKSFHPKIVNCECESCNTQFYRKIRLPAKCPKCHGNVQWITPKKVK